MYMYITNEILVGVFVTQNPPLQKEVLTYCPQISLKSTHSPLT